MKISKDEITWGRYWLNPEYRDMGYEPFYFMWFLLFKKDRAALRDLDMKCFGVSKFWHDKPHGQLNLWFFGFAWSTQWTKMDAD